MNIPLKFRDIKKGTTFNGREMRLYDGIGDAKTPMDLSGVLIEMEFRALPVSIGSCVVFKFTTADNSIEIIETGHARMKTRLMNYPAANYQTDVFLIFPNGTVKNYEQISWKII